MSENDTYSRMAVLRRYPQAEVRPVGVTMLAVFASEQQISRPFTTPGKCWRDAALICRTNAPSPHD